MGVVSTIVGPYSTSTDVGDQEINVRISLQWTYECYPSIGNTKRNIDGFIRENKLDFALIPGIRDTVLCLLLNIKRML